MAAIEASSHIVAQMGPEPLVAALDQEAQVVLCGRAYDPASFAAPALRALRLGRAPSPGS